MSQDYPTRSPAVSVLKTAAADRHQNWRLTKDKIAEYGVTFGGLSIILAVVLIFFYLLYVVFPLLLPAHADSVARYDVPAAELGETVFLAMEEQNEIAARFTATGNVVFFAVADGHVVTTAGGDVPQAAQIASFTHGNLNAGVVAYGLSDGRALVLRQEYRQSFAGGKRLITPGLTYPFGKEPVVIDSKGQALNKLAISIGDNSSIVLARAADNRVLLIGFTKKESLFDDDAAIERQETALDVGGGNIDYMLIDKERKHAYLADRQGNLTIFDVSEPGRPLLRFRLNVLDTGQEITSLSFLNGDLSLLIGDSTGTVSQWTIVRNEQNHYSVEKLRSFKVSDAPVVAIMPEQRRKGFLADDARGEFGIYNTTAQRELINETVPGGTPLDVALSPRANALLVQNPDGLHFWSIDNPHPEVSFSSLWQKVWYESYSKPEYIWQSSSASNDFEPKMSMVPLVFGTIKASFYAMLFAIPLALFGAIYTGYFMAPQIRQFVKPGVEIMGALPTVILGFLAGLWLAPYIELHLSGIFALLMAVPVGVMLFAYLWQFVPRHVRHRLPDGWDCLILVPVIVICGWLALAVSPDIDALLFGGDMRNWLTTQLGINYDQRNTLVVGLAMGFAVIPMIFSIAEDAIFSVPKHLTTGSLALGATPWQTMIKVVLLTASPGIFSAVMIGFGRAVGETMIVLMATGNTPVMDFSIFQGLRTLSANIAVEMPESEVNSTHYRVLFFSALVLFMFTFLVNTLAEVVRQNLRQKYSSL